MVNRNILWAEIFVDELARSGLKAVCAAPGSRHTPLMLAFAKHPKIKVYSHLDERSAAFFALGMAMAWDEPVALVCTSGSAGANYFPAIVEAHQSRVPLIVITADRPPELRHSGANQTIDQIKMFGDYALWFVDTALPEAKPSALTIRNLRTTANRAFATANSLRKGVVHINMPFSKPLEPTPNEGDVLEIPKGAEAREDGKPFASLATYEALPNVQLGELADIFNKYSNGLVLASINSRFSSQLETGFAVYSSKDYVSRFAEMLAYPLIAEPSSGYRFGYQNSIGAYDSFMRDMKAMPRPDVIVRFGDVPTSNWLNQYIADVQPRYYIHFSPSGVWADDSHLASHLIQVKFPVKYNVDRPTNTPYHQAFQTLESTTWQVIDHEIATGEYFDGAVVYDVVDLIPDNSTLFAGNSLSVRHLDQFGKPNGKRIHAYANRGASGIDGNISTALGLGAASPERPLVAVVGDITLYHDMNGLLAVHRCGVPVTIVLLNNDGGGIFNRLPINKFEPEFTDYFLTPHGLDFSHAAKLYGLDYIVANSRDEFRKAFSERVGGKQSTIIEVQTDSRKDEARRQEIVKAVQEALKGLNIND
jgi:2-succinyl-5-enolpyruvyl-6-hydroxy-3-cyclohexene-1-carboxylate synthase